MHPIRFWKEWLGPNSVQQKLAALCRVRRIQIIALISVGLAGTLFDTLGLSMLYPIGEFLLNGAEIGTLIETSRIWSILDRVFSVFGFTPDIWAIAFLSSVFLIARQVLTYIRIVYQAAMSYMIARRMRQALFSGFLKAKLNYQERLFSGPFANSITTETNAASQVISTFLEFVNGVTVTIAYVALLIWLSPGAAVIVIGVLGIVGFGLRGIQRKIRSLSKDIVDVNARFSQHFLEKCASVRLIRLTSSEELEQFQARRLLARQEKKNVSATKAVAITATGIEPMALVIGIPVLIGAVVVGGADVATIGMFLILLARMAPVVRQTLGAWQACLKIRASADNILEVFDGLNENREISTGTASLPKQIDRVRFDGVSFSYPQAATPALNNISLSLDGGTMVAIVGPSGSGKSTLIDLIPRLREPSAGSIRINETDIGAFDIDALRNGCAFVTQNPALISGSIYDYISYGMPNVDHETARRAAEQANAHEFIAALPNGYDTVIGEGGTGLSGGQRQRVELARALARHASILILDEPTSSVDGRSAELIHEAIDALRRDTDTTILIVGHQLGAIRNADKIIVINGGHVERKGTHDELMAVDGWYSRTYKLQSAA